MFKYILFDLDNTIYNYDSCNDTSLKKILFKISDNFKINLKELEENYIIEKKKYQNYCYNASSHNKFIQLKKIFEKYDLDMNKLSFYYDLYMNVFIENIELYPHVLEFIKFCKQKDYKIYILTNNICKDQICKLKEMNILPYFEKIYTSEEFGIEKPDIKLFYYIINDIGCKKNEIVKIGDNYKNDIEPLILNEIYCFWFCKNNFSIKKTHIEFKNYNDLLNFFYNYHCDLNMFLDISNYIGERFDLVQAGGGNISFKIKDILFIKSSGCNLSNININKNYIGVNFNNIKNNLKMINSLNKKEREIQSNNLVNSNIIFLKAYRPSIETTLHCLTKKFTIHIHSIQFNYISSLPNCDKILQNLFTDYCIIDYITPGIDVTIELLDKYKNEKIIFMKNHGLVITSENIIELKDILKNINDKLESYLNLNLKKYHYVNIISNTLYNIFNKKFVSYLVENENIQNFINNCNEKELINSFQSFLPDKIVYCGISCVFIKKNIKASIEQYFSKYNEIPKIFIYNTEKKQLYISSNSLNKCRDIEQVLLSHILCYNVSNILLDDKEIKYLNNWEAEEYRKNII